jgi:hypothetical protein
VKLGFWNRLAIVAGVVTTLAVPTWWIFDERAETFEWRGQGLQRCMELIGTPGSDLTFEGCQQNWMPDTYFVPGWIEWSQLVGVFAALSVITYLVIWAAVSIGKWVWRGKNTNTA